MLQKKSQWTCGAMFFRPPRPFSNWDPNPLRYVQLDAPVLEIDVAELWGHDGLKGKGKVDEGRGPPATPCPAVTACKIFLKFNENRKFSWEKKGEDTPADFQPKLDIKTFSGFICVKLPPRKRAVLFFFGGGSANFWGRTVSLASRFFWGSSRNPPVQKTGVCFLGFHFFCLWKKDKFKLTWFVSIFFPECLRFFVPGKQWPKKHLIRFAFVIVFVIQVFVS